MTVNEDRGYIEILPAAPGVVYVPTYDPLVVFAHPARGLVIGGAITFGAGIAIGGWFNPWGWDSPRLLWPSHAIVIDRPWVRGWVGRDAYAHPYSHPWVRAVGPRVERHEIHRR